MLITLEVLSCLFLGLLTGSLLTEAMLLVPIWKNMCPDAFLKQHAKMGPYFYAYFKPLTILGTSLPLVASACSVILSEFQLINLIPGFTGCFLIGIYFAYFETANARFSDGSIAAEQLSLVLTQWGNWQWLRTLVALFGFVIALIVLVS
jgi:hypothetical protein